MADGHIYIGQGRGEAAVDTFSCGSLSGLVILASVEFNVSRDQPSSASPTGRTVTVTVAW